MKAEIIFNQINEEGKWSIHIIWYDLKTFGIYTTNGTEILELPRAYLVNLTSSLINNCEIQFVNRITCIYFF